MLELIQSLVTKRPNELTVVTTQKILILQETEDWKEKIQAAQSQNNQKLF